MERTFDETKLSWCVQLWIPFGFDCRIFATSG